MTRGVEIDSCWAVCLESWLSWIIQDQTLCVDSLYIFYLFISRTHFIYSALFHRLFQGLCPPFCQTSLHLDPANKNHRWFEELDVPSQCLLRAPLSFGLFVQALHGEEHVEIYRCLGWSIKNAAFGWESWNKWANVKQSNIAMENPPFVLPTDTLGDFNCRLISPEGICSIHMYPCNPNFWVTLRLLLTSCLLHDSDL